MLTILLSWCFITPLLFAYGKAASDLLLPAHKPVGAELYCLFGFPVLAGICLWLSVFVPLNGFTLFGISASGFIYLFAIRQSAAKLLRHFFAFTTSSLPVLFFFLASVAAALMKGAAFSSHFDMGAYYIQFMKWAEEYSVVPGLGNLHGRLAFNSSWHLLNAQFSFAQYTTFAYDDLTELLFVLFLSHLLRAVTDKTTSPFEKIICSLFIGSAVWVGIRELSVPTADLVCVIYIWLSIKLLTQNLFSSSEEMPGKAGLINTMFPLMAAFMLSVKISSLFMLPGIAWCLFSLWKSGSRGVAVKSGLACLVLILPWFIRNYIQAGWIIYPFHALDFFNPDWKIPRKQVLFEELMVESFAKIGLVHKSPFTLEQAKHITLNQWLPFWYSHLKPSYLFILWQSIIALILLPVAFVKYSRNPLRQKSAENGLPIVLFLLLSGICFWFFKAPSFRFGYGYLMALQCLVIALLLHDNLSTGTFSNYPFKVLLIIFGCLTIFLGRDMRSIRTNWFHPPEYIKVKTGEIPMAYSPLYYPVESWDSGKIIPCSEASEACVQCWGARLPCIEWQNKHLEMRSKSLQDGFRFKEGVYYNMYGLE
ncbi:MAG: hypothetical protein V4543_04230 [Bacteroidota bacterium]